MKRHATQIADVTKRRYMPPWLPDGEFGQFVGDRRLSTNQIALFQEWVKSGMPEGAAADLPSAPTRDELWQLGKPDLVVQMPKPYILAASGRDIYRNFVIPVALEPPTTKSSWDGAPIYSNFRASNSMPGLARSCCKNNPPIKFAMVNPSGLATR